MYSYKYPFHAKSNGQYKKYYWNDYSLECPVFSTAGSFKAEFIHRAESTKIHLLDRVPG